MVVDTVCCIQATTQHTSENGKIFSPSPPPSLTCGSNYTLLIWVYFAHVFRHRFAHAQNVRNHTMFSM